MKINLPPSQMLIVCKWSQFNSHTSNLIPKRIWRRTTMLTLKFATGSLPHLTSVPHNPKGRQSFWTKVRNGIHGAPAAWTSNLVLFSQYTDLYTRQYRLSFNIRYTRYTSVYSLLFSRKFTAAIYLQNKGIFRPHLPVVYGSLRLRSVMSRLIGYVSKLRNARAPLSCLVITRAHIYLVANVIAIVLFLFYFCYYNYNHVNYLMCLY